MIKGGVTLLLLPVKLHLEKSRLTALRTRFSETIPSRALTRFAMQICAAKKVVSLLG